MPKSIPPTVLITGAARRIGRVAGPRPRVPRLARRRALQRSAEAAAESWERSAQNGGEAEAFRADLSEYRRKPKSLTPRCVDEFGALDCLINNASLFAEDDPDDPRRSQLAEPYGHQPAGSRVPGPGFRCRPSAGSFWKRHQYHRPTGVAAAALVLLLHGEQVRPVGGDADHGAGARAAHSSQRDRPWPDVAEHLSDDEEFAAERRETLLERGASPEDIAAAVRFILEAEGDDGPNDCARWRPAS